MIQIKLHLTIVYLNRKYIAMELKIQRFWWYFCLYSVLNKIGSRTKQIMSTCNQKYIWEFFVSKYVPGSCNISSILTLSQTDLIGVNLKTICLKFIRMYFLYKQHL